MTLDRIAVSELRGDTFIAVVAIRSGEQTLEVDARPSDALNLAVRSGAPIFVEPEVMRTQSIVAADAPRELDEARLKRGRVPEEDFVWRSWRDIMLEQKRT